MKEVHRIIVIILWILITFYHQVDGLRDRNNYPYVVDYHENYNYKLLEAKMIESMSINNCSLIGDVSYGDGNQEKIEFHELKPPNHVVKQWIHQNNHQNPFRIFAKVSNNLCSSKYFKNGAKGTYKRAKGCYKVYGIDKKGKYGKRFNDYGATLHPEHIRCNHTVVQAYCDSRGSTGLHVIDDEFRELGSFPFVVTAKNVVVSRSGMFSLPCGPFGLFSSCEAVKHGVYEASRVLTNLTICRNNIKDCPYPVHEKVFVLTQYDDTQIGQFMQENLPKLIYHLSFLQSHPEYKIHFGFTKKDILPKFVLPHHFFKSFGLLDRLINGSVYAKEIIMPREGGCQDIGYNAWEMVTMRERFYEMLKLPSQSTRNTPKTILIVIRSAGKFTQNKHDINFRSWTMEQLHSLQQEMLYHFPNHTLDYFSDDNSTLMTCPLCQAEKFANADVVIGYHGAGLSNAMFMRPGCILVEVVYFYDSRHLPVIGIFPRIADIIGLHHFSYYVRDTIFEMPGFIREVKEFYQNVKLWMH